MNAPPEILPPDEHDRIAQEIRHDRLLGTQAQERPRAVILAGQPGAGKTALKNLVLREFARDDGAVVVDTDDLRFRHPRYADLSAENDLTAASRTQPDAGKWADELTEAAIAEKRNLIIDSTLKNTSKADDLCRRLREASYEIDVRAMATAPEDSRLAIERRYFRAKEANGMGRWVPGDVHDAAYHGQTISMVWLESRGLVDQMSVYRRGSPPERIYRNEDVRLGPGTGAADALQSERERPRTAAELQERRELEQDLEERRQRMNVRHAPAIQRDGLDRTEARHRDASVQRDGHARTQVMEKGMELRRDGRARQATARAPNRVAERAAAKPIHQKGDRTHER